MATSRGKGLGDHLSSSNHNFTIPKRVITIPGASIERLTEEATHIINTHPTPQKIHTYFVAGIPDITTMIRDACYEEVIFNDSPQTAHTSHKTILEYAQTSILATKSTPCFATVAPISLKTWNETRLNQLKTHYLIHHEHYNDMQALLIKSIININCTIIELNNRVHMHTPKFCDRILHKQNAHKRNHKVRYGRLVDGVHGNTETKIYWAGEILNSIMINRINHK